MRPIIGDVEAFSLVDATGKIRRCSRHENAELSRAAIGGYGLFGIITHVELRFTPRLKMERIVEIRDLEGLIEAFEDQIDKGSLYGDFQFSTDEASDDFMRRGVFACYRPVDQAIPIPDDQQKLSQSDWEKLLLLGHVDRASAYKAYTEHYQATHGQIYWSDSMQLSTYIEGYHKEVDRLTVATTPGSEVITEIYVPRNELGPFMAEVRGDFLANAVPLIYGTVRLIEADNESFLAWARENYACVIFNLCVRHDETGRARAAEYFQGLIDRAIPRRGSFYLTYHRWARRDQVEACYPQFRTFLHAKRQFDPGERFRSDWYDHHRALFANGVEKRAIAIS